MRLREVKEWPRKIRQGVRSLIEWFPVIWEDRWWDHYFIYAVLRHKLHLMEKNIREHGHHVNHVQDADKIKKCVLLLDRLMKDEYHENVYKPHEEKWGEPDFIFTDATGHPNCSQLHIKHPNAKTREDKHLERKEYRRLIHKPEELKKQDIDMLFDYMKKHIQTWWD